MNFGTNTIELQVDLFAPADRFLWEMHLIPRYEQRLMAIFFKRKLVERMEYVEPRVRSHFGNDLYSQGHVARFSLYNAPFSIVQYPFVGASQRNE